MPCSLRMILNKDVFLCEACGCEFYGEDFPEWLLHAAHKRGSDIQPGDFSDNTNLDDIIRSLDHMNKIFDEAFDDAMTFDDTLAAMISLYSYFYNKGDCPSEEIQAQLLRADCSLRQFFPAGKKSVAENKDDPDDMDFDKIFDEAFDEVMTKAKNEEHKEEN